MIENHPYLKYIPSVLVIEDFDLAVEQLLEVAGAIFDEWENNGEDALISENETIWEAIVESLMAVLVKLSQGSSLTDTHPEILCFFDTCSKQATFLEPQLKDALYLFLEDNFPSFYSSPAI